MAVTATISLSQILTLTKAADLITNGLTANPNVSKSITFATGTGAGQVDLMYAKNHAVVAASPVSLDLAGTSLLNPLGDPIAMVKLKYAMFSTMLSTAITVANAGNIEVGGGSNPVLSFVKDPSDILVLTPGSLQVFYDPTGWPITAATGDLLKLLSSTGTNKVDVILLGTSA